MIDEKVIKPIYLLEQGQNSELIVQIRNLVIILVPTPCS